MKRAPVSSSPRPPRASFRRPGRQAGRLLGLLLNQRGDSLIETAVVLPFFLMVFLGISQYSLVLLNYCSVTYACRQAARYASMHSTSSLAPDTVSQIQGMVTSKIFLDPGIMPTVSVNYYTQALAPGSNVIGNVVSVSVTWNQTLKLAFLNTSSFTISTQNYKIITR
jgi:Flp pilus assembly protein TadG